MVSSELAPLAMTGDLGESVGALARALARRGHDVTAVLPDYGGSPSPGAEAAARSEDLGPLGEFPTAHGSAPVTGRIAATHQPGLQIIRLCCPGLFERPGIYGAPEEYSDNPDRFWVLSVGAVAAIKRLGWTPDIAHGHDWHAGWLPAVVRSQANLQQVPTVHTCYNLAMPGAAPIEWATRLGVVSDLLAPEGIEYFGKISFAKVGLRFADVVVMSSPETQDGQEGLAGVVRARGAAVTRIPRSVDAVAHDPARDLGLPARYSADRSEGKAACKRRLQAATGLEVDSGAVLILTERDQAAARLMPDRTAAPRAQWLPLEGLAPGMRRLAFAGADALLEPTGDPWSMICGMAERYGLVSIMPDGPDVPDSAYTFARDDVASFAGSISRLVSDHAEQRKWQSGLRSRLRSDPEQSVARYETLYRQVRSLPAGPPIPWALPALQERLQTLGV